MPFLAIAISIGALVLALSFACYRRCFYSAPKHHNDPYEPLRGEQFIAVGEDLFRITSIMERYSYEDLSVTAPDGVPLRGRYYHFRDGAPLMILCHGYRSSALRDCSGGHTLSRKMGFNALVIHQRGHGDSGGKTITFGIREREDLMAWIRLANDRFDNPPIILFGLSMGAATVLMGNALGYPDNVTCILADSPYSTPLDIILKVCADLGYPPKLAEPFIRLGASLFGGFRLDACSALEAVRHAKVPILFLHGEDDRMVPCAMSETIRAACASPAQVCTVPDAGHCLSYMTNPLIYERNILTFLNTIPQIRDTISQEFKNSII